jgi:hypothetical protein
LIKRRTALLRSSLLRCSMGLALRAPELIERLLMTRPMGYACVRRSRLRSRSWGEFYREVSGVGASRSTAAVEVSGRSPLHIVVPRAVLGCWASWGSIQTPIRPSRIPVNLRCKFGLNAGSGAIRPSEKGMMPSLSSVRVDESQIVELTDPHVGDPPDQPFSDRGRFGAGGQRLRCEERARCAGDRDAPFCFDFLVEVKQEEWRKCDYDTLMIDQSRLLRFRQTGESDLEFDDWTLSPDKRLIPWQILLESKRELFKEVRAVLSNQRLPQRGFKDPWPGLPETMLGDALLACVWEVVERLASSPQVWRRDGRGRLEASA